MSSVPKPARQEWNQSRVYCPDYLAMALGRRKSMNIVRGDLPRPLVRKFRARGEADASDNVAWIDASGQLSGPGSAGIRHDFEVFESQMISEAQSDLATSGIDAYIRSQKDAFDKALENVSQSNTQGDNAADAAANKEYLGDAGCDANLIQARKARRSQQARASHAAAARASLEEAKRISEEVADAMSDLNLRISILVNQRSFLESKYSQVMDAYACGVLSGNSGHSDVDYHPLDMPELEHYLKSYESLDFNGWVRYQDLLEQQK